MVVVVTLRTRPMDYEPELPTALLQVGRRNVLSAELVHGVSMPHMLQVHTWHVSHSQGWFTQEMMQALDPAPAPLPFLFALDPAPAPLPFLFAI